MPENHMKYLLLLTLILVLIDPWTDEYSEGNQ